jgi:hypothetical protein
MLYRGLFRPYNAGNEIPTIPTYPLLYKKIVEVIIT